MDIIPFEFQWKAFEIIEQTPQHIYLICTKRPHNMVEFISQWLKKKPVLNNCFLGCTVENQKYIERIMVLEQIDYFKKFISFEPLLSAINYTFHDGINWVIVGAESGHNHRECKIEWVESIIEQCKSAGIPVFVKQLHINGKLVKDINQFPEYLRIRERPF